MIEIFIRRRVTTSMIYLGICLVGLISLFKLPVQLLPDIEFPTLTIITPYPNASPSEIEQLITRRIEEAAGSVGGVRDLRSESLEGLSLVTARFNWGTSMDYALIETKEKVDMMKGQLPEDAGKSLVVKFDPASDPVMIYALEAKTIDFKKLRHRIEREILPFLERADGVAMVDLYGGFRRQINVNLDGASLVSHGMSFPEIIEGISAANYNFPAGSLEKGNKDYTVRTIGEFARVSDINEVVVGRNEAGVPVYLGGLGKVEDGYQERKSIIRLDGREAVGLLIRKEPGKNTIETGANVEERVRELRKKYGNELSIRKIYDQSDFIRGSVDNVRNAGIIGALCALAVLWFFLGSGRSALIIAASIPISVLGTFALMYFRGMSLNMMSLGGLALGIGMMVDSGIVVLESVEEKKKLFPKAKGDELIRLITEGITEVRTSVIASAITSLVVFLPILFLSGISGALFGELALTISFSNICTLITSLSLVPMLAGLPGATPGKDRGKLHSAVNRFHGNAVAAIDGIMDRLSSFYESLLEKSIDNMKKLLSAGAIIILLGVIATGLLDSELMPKVDAGEFTIELTASRGTPLEETSALCRDIETAVLKNRYVKHVYVKIGSDPEDSISERLSGKQSNNALIRVILKAENRPHIKDIIDELKSRIRTGELVRTEYRLKEDVVESVLASQTCPLALELYGRDLDTLTTDGVELKKLLLTVPGLRTIESNLDRGNPELRVIVDRARMYSLGVTIASVASTLKAAVFGEVATSFRDGDDEIDVRVRLGEEGRRGRGALEAVHVKSESGQMLPIGKFTSIVEGFGTTRIVRSNQSRVNIITAGIEGNRARVLEKSKSLMERFAASRGMEARMVGEFDEIRKALPEMIFALVLAIVLVYMVLASQLQSFLIPLVIMCSIPLTLPGISGALLVMGKSLNINSGIGIILLSGTVVNNAIVLIDYIGQRIKKGDDIRRSVLASCRRRIRPIMMTTLTTILGMLPLAMGLGEGAELQQPLAVATIGGLALSTFLTLIFIPAIYYFVQLKREAVSAP
jgi:HAE1 family hydrophobic/amphiphilic exporter-1